MLKSLLRAFAPAGRPAAATAADSGALLAQAQSLRREGALEEAADCYAQALVAGAAPVDTLLHLGAVQVQMERYAAAQATFERLVAVDPAHADAWCMLGFVGKEQRRFDQAQQHLERALSIDPAFSEAHFNLGLVLFEQGRVREASRSFQRCAHLRRGEPWTGDRVALLERDPRPPFEPMDMGVNEVKLRHDAEQLEWLLEIGAVPPAYSQVRDDYRALLAEIGGEVDENSLVGFDHARHPLVARTYKRPFHVADVVPPDGPVVNPDLDWEAIQDRYLAAEPNVLAIDGLLTPPALAAVRRFCRESTIWNNIKGGYLGAYFYDGFCSELLLRLASELRERLPRVIRDHPLNMMWGFKCDARLPGLKVHADAAAVNVNFWITEDEANLDPDGGGLRVWPDDAPAHWDFRRFNNDAARIEAFLAERGTQPTRYPYRANRALVFDSDLFHATDATHFREGYLNRRINITLLYGNRLA